MVGRIQRSAFVQSRVGQQFDKLCTIRREGWIVDENVGCTLSPAVDENQRVDDDVVGVGGWIVVLPMGTDVVGADRILIGSQTFMVLRVLGPGSHMASLRVLCSET